MTFGTANHVPLTVVRHRGAPPGEQPVRQSNPILPQPRELIALTALLVLLITLSEGLSPAGLPMLNAFGALALAGILCPGAWRMVRAESRNIWNVLFWLRISIAVYFAFGTAAIYLMNDTTRLFVENLYFFTEPEVLKYIIITTLGTFCILTAAYATLKIMERGPVGNLTRPAPLQSRSDNETAMVWIGFAFVAIGNIVFLLTELPFVTGASEDRVTGVVSNIAKLGPVGLFMLSASAFATRRWLLPVIGGILFFYIVFSLVFFQKSALMFHAIMVALGYLWNRVTVRKVAIAFGCMVPLYVASQDVVTFSRTYAYGKFGQAEGLTLPDRMSVLSEYLNYSADYADGDDRQGWLSRLSYVNAGTFIINLRDTGRPGDALRHTAAVFVPRFLWPDKPIISGTGVVANMLIMGTDTSSLGFGWFAHAYWEGAWTGVVGLLSAVGVLVGILARATSQFLAQGRWLQFPLVLLSMRIGVRTDGDLLLDVMGMLPLLMATYVLSLGLEHVAHVMGNRSLTGSRGR